MKSIARAISLTIVLSLVLALLAACGTPPAPPAPTSAPAASPAPAQATTAAVVPAPTAAKPVILRVATPANEETLTPYTYRSGYPGWNMVMLVYDGLFVMDADSVSKPWLAKEDKISADGKVHTLTLRNDVKWHDGKPFTSADVKFAYEYYKKYTHGRWTPPVKDIVSIETPNETTVVITLPAPAAAFAIQPLADVPIIPKHIWESVSEPAKFVNHIGTGPFKVAEAKPEQLYRFTAHAEYFAGKPAVDELLMPVILEPNTIFSSLKSGEIHATVRELAPELVKDFQGSADLKLQRGPGYATTLLQFNVERAPWDKKEVRQAVGLAIETQKLVDTVLLGFGTAGNPGWLHPSSPFHDPAIKPEFNPTKAKALLDGLGYKDTNNDGVREAAGKPMEAPLLVQSNQPQRIRAAELIAAALKEIGISAKVTPMEATSLTDKVWKDFDVAKGRDFDLSMFGWSAPVLVSPTRMVTLLHSDVKIGTTNIGGFRSAEADKIGNEINVTTDPGKQIELLRQLEKLMANELPFVMLYYQDGIYAYRPAVYDGWVYQKGQGIMHKLSFLPKVKP